MSSYKEIPSITVYSPDRRMQLGSVVQPIGMTEDIRFNAASEVQFSVPEYFYDSDKYTWVKNPVYDTLVEDNLLFLNDNRSYFSFPRESCHDKDMLDAGKYKLEENANLGERRLPINNTIEGVSTYTPKCKRFAVQPETELFDIGLDMGYNFESHAYLGTSQGSDKGVFCHCAQNDRLYRLLACDTFIPVNKGDVVYLRTDASLETDDGKVLDGWIYSYHLCYYTDMNSDTCTHEYPANGFINGYIPNGQKWTGESGYVYERGKIYRYLLEDGTRTYEPEEYGENIRNRNDGCAHPAYERPFPDIRIPVNNQLGGAESGYMRVSVYVAGEFAEETQKTVDGETQTSFSAHHPVNGFIKVYSGERRCTQINTVVLPGRHEPKLQWFTIGEVEETGYGFYKTKTVKAYSYEYTLSKRTFSIQESTLPLYVPPEIIKIVNSDSWVIDNSSKGTITCAQTMKTGLLNQLLEYLPNWKLGYISSKLLTRYRTIGDTDNVNVYSFLMNDIQSLYQCYFVFDNNNKTISAYTKDDTQLNRSANIHLTWDNVIKEINISNSDTNYVTALRVHTAEDTYSLGLVNPTGNNIIYDFTYPKKNGWFDFVADSKTNRTLRQAVEEWEFAYDEKLKGYREYGQNLIDLTLKETQLSSKLALALADYRAKADEINVLIENDYKDSENEVPLSYIIGDKPRTPEELKGTFKPKSKYQNYHSKTLYRELLSLSKTYQKVKKSLDNTRSKLKECQDAMKNISASLTLNCKNKTDTPGLTLAERKALDYYIKEGDWHHENIIFSETYSKDDIYNTLIDVYNDAKYDLNQRLSQPIFEFTASVANFLKMPEMHKQISELKLGRPCHIEASPSNWVSPTLLELHIDYFDDTNTTFTFSTDYNRRPLHNRFADLFNTINQVSVKESVFNFEE